jgi:UDP-GlcNAc:undecaprenyl-phosphate GlcNAc-1-phosphate transferase
VSAVVTIGAVPATALTLLLLLRSSVGRRLVAVPSGDRWHSQATPTFGGVGIYAGFVVGVGLALAVDAIDMSSELAGILCGATLLFVVGLVDDIVRLNPLAKLAAQIAAAAIAIGSGLSVELVSSDALALAIGLVWLVGMTNAFNLLDNMDGLAATLATIACATLAVSALNDDEATSLALALSLGFACLAFLPFNLRPGRKAATFMGDSGSQLIGFTLASLALLSNWKVAGATLTSVVLPLLVLAVPILDTTLVTTRRLLERRPVAQGGRDHTSHRLVYYGLSEGRAVALLALVATAVALTGLAYNELNNSRVTTIGVLVTFVVLVQFASALSDLEERSRRGDADLAGPSLRALFFQPRRIVEVVVDFVCICASFLAAYLLVIGNEGSPYQRAVFVSTLPVLLGARYIAFVAFGIYRRVWRFAGSRDFLAIVAAVAVSEVAAWVVLGIASSYGDFPQRVFVVDAFLCAVAVSASRYAVRVLPQRQDGRGSDRRILVVGAGRFGRAMTRELRETNGRRVVGFVDDNTALRRRRILGVTVLGTLDEIDRLIADASPDEVLVTIAGAPEERLRLVVDACSAAGVPCRVARREVEHVGVTNGVIAR